MIEECGACVFFSLCRDFHEEGENYNKSSKKKFEPENIIRGAHAQDRRQLAGGSVLCAIGTRHYTRRQARGAR
ncbi:unnamed protein product, partial [Trichogramma brassicae]